MMLGKDKDRTENVIFEIVKMGRRKGELLEVRLFAPNYFFGKDCQEMGNWINFLMLKHGLVKEDCPVSSMHTSDGETKIKDSVDGRVRAFVVNHVHKDIGPELIIFVTGDGDFVEFSNIAKNKGKQTEFWSVDLSGTSRFIKREEHFKEIEVDYPSLDENPFLVAVKKATKKLELSEREKVSLKLIAKMADMKLQGCEIAEMSNLISGRLGISHAEADRLLEMLTALNVAEISFSAIRVVTVDYLNVLFQYLRPFAGPEEVIC